MDRLIYTALNALGNLRDTQELSAQNLANLSVPGYRRELSGGGAARFLSALEGETTRAFQLDRGGRAVSGGEGTPSRTGDSMDISIDGEGFFYVQPPGGGEPALTRRGDLRISAGGRLTNAAGEEFLGTGMAPIEVPPFRRIAVDDLGQISVEPLDGPGETLVVGTLATVVPPGTGGLAKSPDGRIRSAGGGPLPAPDQLAQVRQGTLEGSNVNATEELIGSIELQRSFEVNLRMIQTAREMDDAGTALLRMPGA